MIAISNQDVAEKFSAYPEQIKTKLFLLRQLIFDVAFEISDIGAIEETLKWDEPSYITHSGSTIRLGWKKSYPEQYLLYFHCKTTLVDTFKQIYGDRFKYEGNRAIIFNLDDRIPTTELKHCISLSLRYHLIKHLPLLGS